MVFENCFNYEYCLHIDLDDLELTAWYSEEMISGTGWERYWSLHHRWGWEDGTV